MRRCGDPLSYLAIECLHDLDAKLFGGAETRGGYGPRPRGRKLLLKSLRRMARELDSAVSRPVSPGQVALAARDLRNACNHILSAMEKA